MGSETEIKSSISKARRTEKRLKSGAAVSLTTMQSFQADGHWYERMQPAVIKLRDTEGFEKNLVENVEPIVKVSFDQLRRFPDFSFRVFVNMPEANERTPVSASGFLGTIAFFGHGHEEQEKHANGAAESLAFRLPASSPMSNTKSRGDATLTLVPVPYPGERKASDIIPFSIQVQLDLVRSEVR